MVEGFPFDITLADGRSYTQARLLFVDGRVHVFDLYGGMPRHVATSTLTQAIDYRRELRRLHTEHGVWETLRSADCGCRSPLKRMSRQALLDLTAA